MTKASKKKRNHRQRQLRKIKLSIASPPSSNRTLKRSAREALRKEAAPYQWICPWVKEPTYRYEPKIYPASSLLGLPTELRQTILLLTIDPKDDRRVTWEELGAWVGVLKSITPLLRLDMVYVQQIWRQEKREMEAQREKEEKARTSFRLPDIGQGVRRPARKGAELKVRQKQKRIRDQKCWYCEQRHFSVDPVCPLARQNPWNWVATTKPVRVRRTRKSSIFDGKKVVFEDERR